MLLPSTPGSSQPPVSLYIPSFNVAQYLDRCIEGVFGQTHRPDEILVVNDGSTDETSAVTARHPEVRIVNHRTNKGLGASRNTGFAEARNELVASLDADCVAAPNWLNILVREITSDPTVAFVGGRLDETVFLNTADRWRQVHMRQHWGDHRLVNPEFMFGNNNLIRKSVVLTAGGYDEKMRTNGEDADMSRNIRKLGHNFVYLPDARVGHLRHDTTSSILTAFWRYWYFGGRAYFGGITIKKMYRNFRKVHWKQHGWRFLREDWKARRYGLLWVDLLLPFYMSRCDWKLYRASRR